MEAGRNKMKEARERRTKEIREDRNCIKEGR